MRNFFKVHIITIIAVLFAGLNLAYGQTFPVRATTTVLPPYSPYLADYVNTGSEKLSLNILLTDPVQAELQVRLRLKIEGQGISITTHPNYMPAPISIQAGMPLRLTGSDLASYFHPSNLVFEGISRTQFQRTGALPDGLYRICFEVIEYNRSLRVSNTGCATAWMILNDPPIINIPSMNEVVEAQNPQFLNFQWTPRHTGSPNSAFSTVYDFELVEVRPAGRNPNVAIQTTPPIFEKTTMATSLTMGPADPQLIPGMQYAFRVKARSNTVGEQLDLFKNNGYSEVSTFIYGRECLAPENIEIDPLNTSQIKASWIPLTEQTSFTVRYKEKYNQDAQWFEDEVYLDSYTLSNLKPSTAYDVQITGKCGSILGDPSDVITVSTQGIPEDNGEFACGSSSEMVSITNREPLDQLYPGAVIKSGDFNIILGSVSGGNGTFSGSGVASIPWFQMAGFKVIFENVKVNTDHQVYEGLITSVKSEDSRFVMDIDTGDSGNDDGGDNGDGNNDDGETGGEGGDDGNGDSGDDQGGDGEDGSDGDDGNDNGDDSGDGDDNDDSGSGDDDSGGNDDDGDDDGGNDDGGSGEDGDNGGSDGGGDTGGGDNGGVENDTTTNVFGPIEVTFVGTPEKTNENGDNCEFSAKASFELRLNHGGQSKQVEVYEADVSYVRNCETNKLVSASINWQATPAVDIGQVGFVSAAVSSVALQVDADGNLSGSVGLEANLAEDLKLSSVTDQVTDFDVIVKSGITGNLAFSFKSEESFSGNWDFSGLRGINVELTKSGNVIGQLNDGNIDDQGKFGGTINVEDFNINTPSANLAFSNLNLKGTIDMAQGLESWDITDAGGNVTVTGLEALNGDLAFSLDYANDLITGNVNASDFTAFGMEVSQANLVVSLNDNLELQEINGSFNAKHNEFNSSISVNEFLVSQNGLETFNVSGEVNYNEQEVRFLQSEYNQSNGYLSLDAVVLVTAGSATSVLQVDGFKIFTDGTIEMGEVSGSADSGDLFGPLRVTFDAPPQSQELDPEGYKIYKDIKVSAILKMKGNNGTEKEVAITEATIGFKKHPETGAYKDVEMVWQGEISLGTIGFVKSKLQGLQIQVDAEGKLSGTATLEAYLNEDQSMSQYITSIDPSKDIDFVIKKGLTGNFSFGFANKDDFSGSWDFSGISGIAADLNKAGKTVAVLSNGAFNSQGVLSGTVMSQQPVSYENKYGKVSLEQVSLGVEMDLDQGFESFSITEGNGKAYITKLKGVNGKLWFDLNYMRGSGFRATVDASQTQIWAFGMTLTGLNLGLTFDDNFDLTVIEGGLKAMHTKFDGRVDITEFEISDGELKKFNGGGGVAFKGFNFNLENLSYENDLLKVAKAEVILGLSENQQYVLVERFEIDEEGKVDIGKISGEINKSNILALRFNAEFADEAFKGDFNGSLSVIDMQGALDIGTATEDDQTFDYGYLEIQSDLGPTGIPLGPSGLKLTRLGGQLGLNYMLDYQEAGAPPVGSPEYSNYVAGLTLGVGDIANMFEVVGNPVVQINDERVLLTLNGELNVPRLDPMIQGSLNANYEIPANIIDGSVATEIKIPASSGSIFQTENLAVDFYLGDKKWEVHGDDMGGSLLSKINFYDGLIDLQSEEIDPSTDAPVTGELKGKVSFSDSIVYSKDSWFADVDARVEVGFDSYAELIITENSLEGGFGVTVWGEGYLKIDSAIDFDIYASGRASGNVGYYNNLWKLQAELELIVQSGEHSGEYDFEVDLEL